MKNRIPTQYVDTPNGKAIRYAVYNEAGDFLRFEYLILADEPTESGTSLTMENILSNTTAALSLNFTKSDGEPTPDKAFKKLSKWYLLQEYTTAGTYTYTIPNGITELGICMIGGGGSGVGYCIRTNTVTSSTYYAASGGGSGECKSFILDVSDLIELNIVVGEGGENETSGGTTSVNGITVRGGSVGRKDSDTAANVWVNGADGGQPSFVSNGSMKPNWLPAGGVVQAITDMPSNTNRYATAGNAWNTPIQSVNPFESDISSPRKYLLSSGGSVVMNISSGTASLYRYVESAPSNPLLPDIKGGTYKFHENSYGITGYNATGYGNGGGAAVCGNNASISATATPGAGSDGAVFIYAR